ncbi:cytochrome b561 domain-containing protein [Canna indica]|uniref:Cytochrome b561 domain-containing protein n=1 Tax=Canna indica TaxID=4628 RepID=A0AAQ3QKC1_9LILI|nr:cytochrome b561 domain-containing protein [Canna indica]
MLVGIIIIKMSSRVNCIRRLKILFSAHVIVQVSRICVLGIANIYVGLHAYHQRSSRSVSLWSVLFTAEVSIAAFIFLFQDRWDYMVKEGVDEQVTPTSNMTSPNSNLKELDATI